MSDQATAVSPMERYAATQRIEVDDSPIPPAQNDGFNPDLNRTSTFQISQEEMAEALAKDQGAKPPSEEQKPAQGEAPKPVAKPEDTAPPAVKPEDKEPKTAKDWKTYKEKTAQELAALQKQLADKEAEWTKKMEEAVKAAKPADTSGINPEEHATLKKEWEQMSERLKLHDLENHPRFKAYFNGQIEAQVETVKRLVGKDNEAKVAEAMAMPDGNAKDTALDELLEGLPMWKRGQVSAALLQIDEVKSARAAELAKGGQALQRAIAADKAEAAKAFSESLTQGRQLIPALQRKEGDAARNAEIEKMEAQAKAIFDSQGSMSPKERADAALWAASAPLFLSQMLAMEKGHKDQVATLQAEIARLTGAKPSTEGQPAADVPTQDNDSGAMGDINETIKRIQQNWK